MTLTRMLIPLLALACLADPARARTPAEMTGPPAVAVPKPPTEARGLLAILGHMKHVTPEVAMRLVAEAREVLTAPGNGWLPLPMLLGMAVNESDLRWWLRLGLDCGMYQNRVNQFVRGTKAHRNLCIQLSKSSKMSAEYAMKELNRYRERYCLRYIPRPEAPEGLSGWHQRQAECALSIYFQGPFWLTRRGCKIPQPHWMTPEGHAEQVRRCEVKNRYWLRSTCFAVGVHLGQKPRWTCRKAWTMAAVARAYGLKSFPMEVFGPTKEQPESNAVTER